MNALNLLKQYEGRTDKGFIDMIVTRLALMQQQTLSYCANVVVPLCREIS